MGIRALSSTSVSLPVGGLWVIEVETTDDDGYLTTGAPSVVVTLPGGTTANPTFTTVTTGKYKATYTAATEGRYIATVTDATYGVATFAAWVTATTVATGMPTEADVAAYLGETSYTATEIQAALDAEAAAQRAMCKVGAIYPDDLREALLRRVARNLALRDIPIAGPIGDAQGGPSFIPGRDPEVRRLEAPYRKRVVG